MSEFDLQLIREHTFVRDIDFHWETESTNDIALRRAEHLDTVTPLLVLAERQTQGRGRGQNRWQSSTGSLTFSLLLDLQEIPPDRLPQLSLTAGLAICQALEMFAPAADLAIKWPNDVYLGERKVAGMLIEVPPQRPPRGIIGIGINANNSLADYPDEVRRNSISLVDATEHPLPLTELLVACLQHLERLTELLNERPHALVDQWQAYHLLAGRQIEVDAYGENLRGVCDGIDADGALRVVTPRGLKRCLGGIVVDFERRG